MTDIEKKYLKSDGFYISPTEVNPGARVRKNAPRKDVEELKQSIVELGQLQPIVLTRENELLAGGTRLLACAELGRKVWAVYTDDVDEILLLKIQLHENIKRANLTAVEETLLKDQIYQRLLERTKGRANQADLAKELQQSAGLISEDLKHATYIKQLPEFFKDCQTKAEIRQKVKRMEKKAEEFILSRTADALGGDGQLKHIASITGVEHAEMEREKQRFSIETPDTVRGRERNVEEKVKEYNQRLMFGDWQENLPKVKEGQIDLMLLDPPWGVELQEKVEAGMLQGDAYDDTEEEFLKTFPILIKLCYEKMRSDGHLYCFFAIRHYDFIWKTFRGLGFSGSDRPIVIHKEGRASGRQGNHWPVSSYELLGLFKKGRRALNHGGVSDLQSVPWISPTDKRGHPSAKPPEVYSRILGWSARPGDTVCDPTYGTGAAFVACEERADLKLNWFGWERDASARRIALMNLTEFQVKLMQAEVSPAPSIPSNREHIKGKSQIEHEIPDLPDTFIGLEPQTDMWKRYWEAHPEQQPDMLAYRKVWKEKHAA